MNWYISVFKNYANFNGRARRQEYWMFTLIHTLVYLLLIALSIATSSTSGPGFLIGLVVIYMLGALVPSLALAVRRMHDLGKEGIWILISLVPFIGGIWFFILTVTEGDRGDNEYGPDPKA